LLKYQMADPAPCQCTAVIWNLWLSHIFIGYFNLFCSIWVYFVQ
jgi:hypothetical protein